MLCFASVPGTAQGASRAAEPRIPVTAADFHFEPAGVAPQFGHLKIPNPQTPDGEPIDRDPACQLVFRSGPGVTSQTVNRAIQSMENTLTHAKIICLAGTFTGPIDVWGKYDPKLLTIEAAPGHQARLALGAVQPSAVNPNEYDGVAGAVSIVDSTDVQVRGLTITGYHYQGFAQTPAGIYVEVRGKGFGGTPSACFTHGAHACGNIYLIDNHIADIANTADEVSTVKRWCNSGNVDAFGIEAESYGKGPQEALQHVVIENNVIDHTRTGESETVAINGDVSDFLVFHNKIYDTDNIGIDTEGWYNGTSQANHGFVADNTIANVDTWNNTAYGVWSNQTHTCQPLQPNAGGIYDDGGAYIWINHNVVANTDQGISLDTENANRWTDHILVSHNVVWDSPGTRRGDPSFGPNPPGIPGRSTVAGHAYDAFYVDAFGSHARIYDVYAYDNSFNNSSRHFGGRRLRHSDVVDFGGLWKNVVLWDNTISGGGKTNPWVFALGIANHPITAVGTTINCTTYHNLSDVHHNFYLPTREFQTLLSWQTGNGYGWDAQSVINARPACAIAKP
ncbi:MAG: hypothetical protein C7B45_07155 [Sulfobacillus acidophilus]|uniref:Right handed beta helix domain-containing protein n=1 Tax=Sulfobacillus acidophilus TaxID=53633 RepID=A0A2T2WJG2_9FIRM|nr:MAG: hypothetical protein C7B45_07155 [Sulfobacillus acidophilus]